MRGWSRIGLNKQILLDRRNRLGGYMMILANGYHHNENTLKLLSKGPNRLAAINAPLGVDDAQLFGHHQDSIIRLWAKFGFGYMKALQINELTSVWRPPEVKGHRIVWMSPEWCWLWYGDAENRLTSCFAALPSSLIGFPGQTVLNLKKLSNTFVQLGLKIIYGKFHDDWT